MNKDMIENLKLALENILAMSEDELFKDFDDPNSKYYFSELTRIEDIYFAGDMELFEKTDPEGTNYKLSSLVEVDISEYSVNNFCNYDYACAA